MIVGTGTTQRQAQRELPTSNVETRSAMIGFQRSGNSSPLHFPVPVRRGIRRKPVAIQFLRFRPWSRFVLVGRHLSSAASLLADQRAITTAFLVRSGPNDTRSAVVHKRAGERESVDRVYPSGVPHSRQRHNAVPNGSPYVRFESSSRSIKFLHRTGSSSSATESPKLLEAWWQPGQEVERGSAKEGSSIGSRENQAVVVPERLTKGVESVLRLTLGVTVQLEPRDDDFLKWARTTKRLTLSCWHHTRDEIHIGAHTLVYDYLIHLVSDSTPVDI